MPSPGTDSMLLCTKSRHAMKVDCVKLLKVNAGEVAERLKAAVC